MDILCLVFPVLIYRVSADSVQNDKRLVLHSDTDVVQEINKLRTELNNQKSEIQNLTTTLTSKLQEKDAIIQNLTTSLNEHTSKLSVLEQTVAKQPTHASGIILNILVIFVIIS